MAESNTHPDHVRQQAIFATTHWSVVLPAARTDTTKALAALEQLCHTYWYPLISTIAYEATGSLNQSHEMAGDTFVAAWRRLSNSRKPIKLRSWLCALARELTDDYLRRRAGIRSENQMGNSDYK
jgi:DNA-directed RNA polymerase specialized sigma24 family protein